MALSLPDYGCDLGEFGIVGMAQSIGDYTEFILCCGCRVRVSGRELWTAATGATSSAGVAEVLTERLVEHVDACPTFACALAAQEAEGRVVFVFALERARARAAGGA